MRNALLSLVALLAIVSSGLSAGTMAFPKNDPCFNVSLPEGWLTHTEDDGSIKFAANDKTPIVTMIRRVKAHTDAELKAFMPKAAQTMAKNFKDSKVSDVTEATSPSRMTIFEIKMTGTDESGAGAVFILTGFSPQKGKYFIASVAAAAKDFDAHENEFRQVVNAISPLR